MPDAAAKRIPRLVGGVSIHHPGHSARTNGETSYASLCVDRGLRSGNLDEVRLDERELLRLAEDSIKAYRVLRALSDS